MLVALETELVSDGAVVLCGEVDGRLYQGLMVGLDLVGSLFVLLSLCWRLLL